MKRLARTKNHVIVLASFSCILAHCHHTTPSFVLVSLSLPRPLDARRALSHQFQFQPPHTLRRGTHTDDPFAPSPFLFTRAHRREAMLQHVLSPANASARVGSTVVVSQRKRSTRARTTIHVVASSSSSSARRDADDVVDRRAFIATSFAAAFSATAVVAAPARAGGNDDADENFASKLSAKEARKAQILAEARAKAAAQASSTGGGSSAPKNADFVVTGDPGRGGGPDAPNTAQ